MSDKKMSNRVYNINSLPIEILINIIKLLPNDVNNLNLVNTNFNESISLLDICSRTQLSLNTSLIKSIEQNNIELFEMLIDNGANNYKSALVISIINNNINMVKLLLPLLRSKDDNLPCAMHNAVRLGLTNIVELLIVDGIKISYESIYTAIKNNYSDIINLIIIYNIPYSKLITLSVAATNGCTEIYSILIDNMDYTMATLNNSLSHAVINNKLNMVKLLLKLNANDYNKGLSIASTYNYYKIAELMINNGATNIKYSLFNAKTNGNTEVVELILNRYPNLIDYMNLI